MALEHLILITATLIKERSWWYKLWCSLSFINHSCRWIVINSGKNIMLNKSIAWGTHVNFIVDMWWRGWAKPVLLFLSSTTWVTHMLWLITLSIILTGIYSWCLRSSIVGIILFCILYGCMRWNCLILIYCSDWGSLLSDRYSIIISS